MPLAVRKLGLQPYYEVWQDMQRFTAERDADTADELWLLEHPPVFTLGRNGKPEHVHDTGDIPLIQVDRGGQVVAVDERERRRRHGAVDAECPTDTLRERGLAGPQLPRKGHNPVLARQFQELPGTLLQFLQ